MSKTLTGAIGLVAGRMKTRAENPEDEPIEGEDEGAETGAETEGDPKESAAEGDPAPEDDDPAAEGEGDEEDGDQMSADFRRGFSAANRRAATILGSEHANRVPTLAARLAFETSMTADDAVATMAAAAADAPLTGKAPGDLSSRMEQHRRGVKPSAAPNGKASGGDAGLLASAQSRFSRRRGTANQ